MMQNKTTLRTWALAERKMYANTSIELSIITAAMAQHVIDFLHTQPLTNLTLAGYWPIRGEIDILSHLQDFCKQHIHTQLVLPCVEQLSAPIDFRSWSGDKDDLTKDACGIPCPTQKNVEVKPDICFVPCLAVDTQGYRLGYGQGYYDRTMAAVRTEKDLLTQSSHKSVSTKFIGIVPKHFYLPTTYPEQHDQRLNAIITENGMTTFVN
jgi:5-formyltetrahydrofolate cyclo-ligase